MITALPEGGHRHPNPVPGLDARPDRHRLSRGERAPQRLRLRRQRRPGCARRRRPLHRAQRRRRRRRRHAGAPRCDIRRAGRDRVSRRRRCATRSPLPPRTSRRWTTCTPAPPTAGALPPPWRAGRSSTPATRQPEAGMRVELQVNGRTVEVDVEPRSHAARLPARDRGPQGHARRLRARRVRRLHHPGRRRAGAILPDAGGAGRRAPAHHHRGPEPRPRRAERAAGCLLRDARAAVRLLHARHDPGRPRAAGAHARSRRAPTSSRPSPATCAAARATARSSRRSRWPPSACAAPTSRPARA